jgi:ABC-type glycerol-3-phosphate transport system permease component
MIMARARMSFARVLSYAVLIGGSVIMLMPFFWLTSTSLKTLKNVYVFPIQWWPDPIRWQNYTELFEFAPVLKYFKNTLILVFFNVIGALLSSSIAAYSFARLRFRGRDLLFSANLAMIMLPFAVVMVPTYVLFTKLKWVGTFLPLIVPQYFGGPVSIFMLRQFFRTIPMELEDAALIDGASRPRIFFQIILPLARPALVVLTIQAILFNWNNFLQPLIYLTNRDLYTLALGVNSLSMYMPGVPDTVHYQMALSSLMVLPPVILYFAAQRAFVRGIALTGLKG